jgi:hypothetical protein
MLRIGLALLLLASSVSAVGAREFVAQADDFKCLFDGTKVEGKSFYVFNRNKRKLRKALKIANRDLPKKRYPVGTILQLFPFEAMVKRGGKFNPAGDGWEFLRLAASAQGTQIVARGGIEVANAAGSCQGCHAAAQTFDFVCEGHGVAALPFTPGQIAALQKLDPRCSAP